MKSLKLFICSAVVAAALVLSPSGTLSGQKGKPVPPPEPPAEFRFPIITGISFPVLTGDLARMVTEINGVTSTSYLDGQDGISATFWSGGNPHLTLVNTTSPNPPSYRYLSVTLADPPCLTLSPSTARCEPCGIKDIPFKATGDSLWFYGLGTTPKWDDPYFKLIAGNLYGMSVDQVGYSMMPFRFVEPDGSYLVNFGDRAENPDPGRSRVKVTRVATDLWHVEGIEDFDGSAKISTGRATFWKSINRGKSIEVPMGLCSTKVDFWIKKL